MPDQPETFDIRVCAALKDDIRKVLEQFPEVDSISASINWKGKLNDAEILHGVWISREGGVTSVEGIFGSIFQGLKMLELQFSRLVLLRDRLRAEVVALAKERVDGETAKNPAGTEPHPPAPGPAAAPGHEADR